MLTKVLKEMPQTVAFALAHEGDERMASAMLASGNPKLAKAARHWAYTRGMALVSPPRHLDDG